MIVRVLGVGQFRLADDDLEIVQSADRQVELAMDAGDEAAFGGFMSSHYHRASDEWREDLELGGATEDILLHVALLHFFGNEASYRPGDD